MTDMNSIFDKNTADWFAGALGEPTPVQKEAWPAIAGGKNTLVSAPTGTGKTLSAFLVFIDRLTRQAREGTLTRQLHLIYISPLKSLAADIRENLRRPLDGLAGQGGEEIEIAIRTGDTPPRDRQRMIKYPPHILITTPESLYLMLTSKTGQGILATAKAIILDELHALIDTKRGAHLMLSVARLDKICSQPLQRIGLSATIEPLSTAAAYLSPEPAAIIAPAMKKEVQLIVTSPFADVTAGKRKDPVWEELAELVYRHCQGSRSVIAFVEGRRYAEKLAYYVNRLGGEGYARVHHGSLSREQRFEVEHSLRDGSLRLLCATSSMELGIDVGEIDQVLQVGCPRTISGTMQRLGRAGHNPGRVSVMYLFPRTAAESVSCGMTAELARRGGVEFARPPIGCLDILAQHLVSMAAFRSYEVEDVMEILPRAYSFRDVSREDVEGVLGMLAGDFEHERDIPVRPRILYDRIHGHVEGDGYSRMLAVSAGGTIPDRGLYAVRTEEGVKVGEVDEEFVYESQKGDRFLLGAFAWRVLDISRDSVTVTQSPIEGARVPFWRGELKGRDLRTSKAFGQIFHQLQEASEKGALMQALYRLGLDEAAAKLAEGYLKRQIAATEGLPDDKTILVEHFRDQSGNAQVMIHSLFGRRVNTPLSLLLQEAARAQTGQNVGCVDEEDGILLYSYGQESLPEGLLFQVSPETSDAVLEALLPATPLFHVAFRHNSGRALMMGVKKNGRLPLWMQRLRSAEMLDTIVREKKHPLILETKKECLTQMWDPEGVKEILHDIRSGAITVREFHSDVPSPMSLPLQWQQEAAVMYDYYPTPRGVHASVEEELKQIQMIAAGKEELERVQERSRLPEDEKQLHTLLMTEGDLAAGELDIPIEWLESLAVQGRAAYVEPGLWIAMEHREEYLSALSDPDEERHAGRNSRKKEAPADEPDPDSRLHIVRRLLRYRGAHTAQQVAERYFWPEEEAERILGILADKEEAVEKDGVYYHGRLYDRARRETIKNLRSQVTTKPASSYAALLASRMTIHAPAAEQLERTVEIYAGKAVPAANWESVILPARVKGYRESLLDTLLAEGKYFWHMEEPGMIRFDEPEDIDWDTPPDSSPEGLTEKEQMVYQALLKRGASFMQALQGVLPGESPHEILLSLLEKGLVYADSFVPVRQWLDKDKTRKATARQRVNTRVMALHAGRWDVVRPLRERKEQEWERCFDRSIILCRETAAAWNVSWQDALRVLRIQEYTGQVRRGYFVEGLSGAQFIRDKDFHSALLALEQPQEELSWLNAADPAQIWGKVIPHLEGRSFTNVPGTAVAIKAGVPQAVFERQGKTLRTFGEWDEAAGTQMLQSFAAAFRGKTLFAGIKRVVVKEYPAESAEALAAAGFIREMQDYVLYR